MLRNITERRTEASRSLPMISSAGCREHMADYSYDAMGRLSSALGGGMRYDYRYYEGGAGQMNTIYSWGTLKEARIIFDMDTVVIK